MWPSDGVRLAVDLGEVPVHVRELLDALNDREPEEVGEGDFAAAVRFRWLLTTTRLSIIKLCRDGAHWSLSGCPAMCSCFSTAAAAPRRICDSESLSAGVPAFGLRRRLRRGAALA